MAGPSVSFPFSVPPTLRRPLGAGALALSVAFAAATPSPAFAGEKKPRAPTPVSSVCQGEYVLDLTSGRPLHARNADTPMLPASLSKMLTAMMTADLLAEGKARADEPVRAYLQDGATYIPGPPSGDFEVITVEQALRATAIVSNNRAARALERLIAERQGASFGAVARAKALDLGMADTSLVEGSGISDESGHLGLAQKKKLSMPGVIAWLSSLLSRRGPTPDFNVSTPADISRMTAHFSSAPRYTFLHPIFSSRRVVDDPTRLRTDPDLAPLRRVLTLHGNLKNERPVTVLALEAGDVTGKTGYTRPAGASMTFVDQTAQKIFTVMQCPSEGKSTRTIRVAALREAFGKPASIAARQVAGAPLLQLASLSDAAPER